MLPLGYTGVESLIQCAKLMGRAAWVSRVAPFLHRLGTSVTSHVTYVHLMSTIYLGIVSHTESKIHRASTDNNSVFWQLGNTDSSDSYDSLTQIRGTLNTQKDLDLPPLSTMWSNFNSWIVCMLCAGFYKRTDIYLTGISVYTETHTDTHTMQLIM